TPREIVPATIDQSIGKTMPALRVGITNVGLGPALDLALTARTREDRVDVGSARIAVVGLRDEPFDYDIPLSGIQLSWDDVDVRDFDVLGDFADRKLDDETRQPITRLAEAGLRDEQQAAQRIAAVRAALWVTLRPGQEVVDFTATYPLSVGNNGRGDALNVVLHLLDDAGEIFERIEVADSIRANFAPFEFAVALMIDHPTLTAELLWTDGTGDRRESGGPFTIPALPQ